ncbi:hypothetical protein HanIR_Chr11g0504091 [Helianthus annuus]|nr:hypothetical protein HanIR_Chr11g0504091 [Helianthus annuus]
MHYLCVYIYISLKKIHSNIVPLSKPCCKSNTNSNFEVFNLRINTIKHLYCYNRYRPPLFRPLHTLRSANRYSTAIDCLARGAH